MQGYTLRSETYNPWGAPPQYQADSGVPGMTVALPVAVPFQPQVGSGFNSYLFNIVVGCIVAMHYRRRVEISSQKILF